MRHLGGSKGVVTMLVGVVALAACASSESPGTSKTGAGGSTGAGGTGATGGAGGAPATGGASGAGGAPGTGGVSGAGGGGAGGATGGTTGTGGGAAGSSGAGGGGGTAAMGTPSAGCSVASPPTGTTIDGTITVGGQQRTYRLSVPTDYVAGQALPVVFVFNGVGGTGPQAQQGFKLETGHRAIFIYPTALPNSQTPGQIAWDFSLTGVDVPFFDALVTFLTQSYCVDTSRLFALGASSGAIMSNMLGCFRGDVLRAIAPSSGMDWKQGGCKGDVAVMVICGAQDTFNPCDDATNGAVSETNVWVPQNGCTTTTSPSSLSDICVDYQGCKSADPVLLCTQPGGHGWPTSNGDFWWQFFMSLD
jgi:polyhydroxybutyrate depolymerase